MLVELEIDIKVMRKSRESLPEFRGVRRVVRSVDLLNSRRNDPYEAATAALREDTQQWWADTLARDPTDLEEDEEPFTADAEGLRSFLEGEVLPWFEARKKELANRPLIREQAFGESLPRPRLHGRQRTGGSAIGRGFER